MRNPSITFETSAEIETDVANIVLTDVARYEGVIEIQLVSSTKVLSYQVRAYDQGTRTLTVQVWDEASGEGAGELVQVNVDDIATLHVC